FHVTGVQTCALPIGGGIHFTGEGYPLDKLADRLNRFADDNGVQVYLEPGEAAITNAATLEVTVLDTLFNGKNLAIVDSSIEAHRSEERRGGIEWRRA